MSVLSGIRARIRALLHSDAADRELRDEIAFHIDLETEKNVRLGMTPDEAHRVALAHFGGVSRTREEHRDVRRFAWIEDAALDARYALRGMRHSPALFSAALLTIALGIGATVAVFSAVNAVVLRPLPFPSADRLMVITEENPEKHWHLELAAPANIVDWRAGVSDFADVSAYMDGAASTALLGMGEPRQVSLGLVMGSFFTTLGVRAALGTTFQYDDTWRKESPVAVLSDAAWRREFNADPSIVGKSVRLGDNGKGKLTKIVGVMPPGFSYPREGIDVWACLAWADSERTDISFRRAHWLRAFARLRPGVTQSHADAQLQAVVQRLKHDYPETNAKMGALMMPLQAYLTRDTRTPLLVLFASAAFLLLIACTNVGNLLLVRAAGRDREVSLRLALGAGRERLARQAVTESLVLSAFGGALGLALGWIGTRVFVRLQPDGLLNVREFGVDAPVVAFVVAISVVSGLLFAVSPALWARRGNAAASLNTGGRGLSTSAASRRWRDALVVAEVALALLMLMGGALLARSFWRLRHVPLGFDPHGVLAVETGVREQDDARVAATIADLRRRAAGIPGVTDAAVALTVPLWGPAYTSDYTAYGRAPDAYGTEVSHLQVSPEYFRTMRVRLLRGRTFNANDRLGAPTVVVINEALAHSYFQNEDPIGQRITFDRVATAKSTWSTIVGVIGDERFGALDTPVRPAVYGSLEQNPSNHVQLLLRTSGDPASLGRAVRRVMREVDPTNALVLLNTMDDIVSKGLARMRFLTTLMLSFAFVGLVLSVVGVYGVLAQGARNRTREMGIRMALGAESRAVRWLVVRDGLALTAVGLAIGAALTWLVTPAMRSLLYGVSPTDVTSIGVAIAVIGGASAAAAWIPARRASLVDPVIALRAD